jgi:hypothetical protein
MSSNSVQQIEQAITTLSPAEIEELREWFDQYEHPLDIRLAADLSSGRLDQAIQGALTDERNGRVQPL